MALKQALPALGVVAMLLLAGCGSLGGGTQSPAAAETDRTVVDAVPAKAEIVVVADPVGLATDPTTETVANELLSDFGQPANYSEIQETAFQQANRNLSATFSELGADANLTVSGIGRLATFSTQPAGLASPSQAGAEYGGVIVQADLTAAEVASLYEQGTAELPERAQDSVMETTYNGVPFYRFNGSSYPNAVAGQQLPQTQSTAFAVLDSEAGLHAAGTPQAVRDAVDTYLGEAPGVAEDIRPQVTDRTYLSAGVNATATDIESLSQDGSLPGNATSVTGALRTGEETVSVEFAVTFDTATAAQTAADQARQNLSADAPYDTSVSVDGQTAQTTLTATATETADGIQQLIQQFAGTGMASNSAASS